MPDKAVIIIDMLNDFVTGDLKCERANKIIPNLKKLIEAARANEIPVIYSNDAHSEDDFEVVNRWGKHAMKGTSGAEVISELKQNKKDYIVDKNTYSGFFETKLEPLLKSKGIKTVILGGLHSNMCVRHTAADAFFRGYEIVITEDGVEAFTEEYHKEGLEYLKFAYNAKIIPVDEIIREFKKS